MRRSNHAPICRTGRIVGRDGGCIVDEMGKVVREPRAASEPDVLIETLTTTGLDLDVSD
jgi:hypothetical protein